MCVLMFSLLTECRVYWEFMLCLGILSGVSSALISTTALSSVSHWFKRKRGIATGIAMSKSPIGGVVMPLLLRSTFDKYSWNWSIRILAFTRLACLVIGSVFTSGRLKPDRNAKKRKIIDFAMFGDMRFTFLTLSPCSASSVCFLELWGHCRHTRGLILHIRLRLDLPSSRS